MKREAQPRVGGKHQKQLMFIPSEQGSWGQSAVTGSTWCVNRRFRVLLLLLSEGIGQRRVLVVRFTPMWLETSRGSWS